MNQKLLDKVDRLIGLIRSYLNNQLTFEELDEMYTIEWREFRSVSRKAREKDPIIGPTLTKKIVELGHFFVELDIAPDSDLEWPVREALFRNYALEALNELTSMD